MNHSTGTGHIPAASAVSWGCTCGEAEIWTYGRSVPPPWAMRLMARRAEGHRRLAALDADLKET